MTPRLKLPVLNWYLSTGELILFPCSLELNSRKECVNESGESWLWLKYQWAILPQIRVYQDDSKQHMMFFSFLLACIDPKQSSWFISTEMSSQTPALEGPAKGEEPIITWLQRPSRCHRKCTFSPLMLLCNRTSVEWWWALWQPTRLF